MNKDAYNAIAAAWDLARTSFYRRERDYLDIVLSGLPGPSSILDLGCGTGRPMAEYVLARGHHLIGVDQAENLLNLARHRLPQGEWIESSIEDFESKERYAGIVCWDALFHIERVHHPTLLARMRTMLDDGGRLMISVGGSDHPPFTDTMFGETFFYDSYPPDKVRQVLRGCGFDLVVAEFLDEAVAERDKGRYAIVARV